jgi:hypothetical protein
LSLHASALACSSSFGTRNLETSSIAAGSYFLRFEHFDSIAITPTDFAYVAELLAP